MSDDKNVIEFPKADVHIYVIVDRLGQTHYMKCFSVLPHENGMVFYDPEGLILGGYYMPTSVELYVPPKEEA